MFNVDVYRFTYLRGWISTHFIPSVTSHYDTLNTFQLFQVCVRSNSILQFSVLLPMGILTLLLTLPRTPTEYPTTLRRYSTKSTIRVLI